MLEVDTYRWFYKENKDRLYAYLLRMTGEPQSALDLVQESFARYLARYGGHDCSKSLLYTIARNAALDAIRKQKPGDADPDLQQSAIHDPEQQVIQREAFNRTMAAIGRLGPQDRELIALVTAADLGYRQIAHILKTSEASIKVRVHRARMKLKKILASGGD